MEPEGGDFVADGVDVAEGDGAHDDDVESGPGIRQTRTTQLHRRQLFTIQRRVERRAFTYSLCS